MTDEERLEKIDLTNESSDEEDIIWAIDYLLHLPVDDDMPLVLNKC